MTGVSGRFRHNLLGSAEASQLPQNDVRALTRDSTGQVWLGTWGGGLHKMAPPYDRIEQVRSAAEDSKDSAYIRVLYEDQGGAVWVGTLDRGAWRYDPGKKRFRTIRRDSSRDQSLSDNKVWSFFVDEREFLWIGTNRGLNRLDRNTGRYRVFLHNPHEQNSLSHDAVNALYMEGRPGVGSVPGEVG